MPIPSEITEAVASTNLKNIGEAGAFYSGLAMGNAVAHQQGLQQIQAAIIAKAAEEILSTSPTEAVATNKVVSGNDLAQMISGLMAAAASGQQQAKAAQTTPPVTA